MAWARNIYFSSEDFVLDVPTFDFPDQGVTCIWGASGSGKSTFLQCLAGLIENKNLKLSIGGELISELSLRDRNVGFVFQDFALFPHLSVWGNIAFAAEAKNLAPDIWKERAKDLIKRLSLEKLISQKASVLSGGEQQRVALARALVTRPKLVLLDEPLSALDERLKEEARILISELSQEFKVPFILVTHDIRDVREVSSHILVLSEGKNMGSGSTSKILSDPDNLDLARLIPENQALKVKLEASRVFLADYDIGNVKEKPSQTGTALITKNWSFEVVSPIEKEGFHLTGRLSEFTDLGPWRHCLVKLSDQQVVKAQTSMRYEKLAKGNLVNLRIDKESMILFRSNSSEGNN